MKKTGKYVISTTSGEEVKAFVPNKLPEKLNKDVLLNLMNLLLEANSSIDKLNIASSIVPDDTWLLYSFIRKEAVISSQIEGTQSTLADLFKGNEKLPSNGDLEEVCNYIKALEYSIGELKKKNGLPLSLRLIKETHKILMSGVRGYTKNPGEFRASQNWIGGERPSKAKFVPPPPKEMLTCLSQLEEYLHKNSDLDPLIRIAMIHVQFETIHPFLDGNGRLGRLLISLLLHEYSLLKTPLLYLSVYFKKNREDYYSLLNSVRFEGVWEKWVEFFLQGIVDVSKNVIDASVRLQKVTLEDRVKLLKYKKVTVASIRLLEELPYKPITRMPEVCTRLKLSKPAAVKAINILQEVGILVETTGKKKDKIYNYKRYLAILEEGAIL